MLGGMSRASATGAHRAPDEVTLVLVLGLLAAFGPLAIDMYLPAFPAIGRDFGASPSAVGWTLAVYFAGLSLGQLVVGPITDRIGRTRPLRAGLGLFVLGSAAAALAPSIELLVVARALQALGGATCAVTSRAVVRDLYRGAEAARMNSRLVLVMGVAPMVAPLAGGALLDLAGWRAIFAVLVVIAIVTTMIVAVALPETAPRDLPPSRPLATLRAIVADRGYVGHALVVALAQAGMFAYITGAPIVFIQFHHVSPGHFGWYFGANAAGYVGCSQLNARLVRAARPEALLAAGLAAQAIAGLALIGIAVGDLGLAATAIGFFAFVGSLGLILPNAIAIALEDQGARAGNAAAWMGAAQFAVAAGASSLVSALADGTPRPVAGVMLGLTIAASTTLAVTRARIRSAAP
jgi:DHA1 family bicyclomycin/chloramphenicol resistance-like MFS transporter